MNHTPEPLFARRPANFCIYSDCVERASYHEMPICREHAAQAWKAFEDVEPESYKRVVRGEAKEVAAEKRAAKTAAAQNKRFNKLRPGSIYYLQVGDRVKIGFTTDLYQRMMQYPPQRTPLTEKCRHKAVEEARCQV